MIYQAWHFFLAQFTLALQSTPFATYGFNLFKFCPYFETGLSAHSHKQHGRHASAVSGYTLAEQKVNKQQLIKVSLPW